MPSKFRFDSEFYKRWNGQRPDYNVVGVLTKSHKVYPLGTDTKVLSSMFELIARPLIYEIASTHGFRVKEARAQNVYPDFTLLRSAEDKNKIAVDVKTTYRKLDEDWRVKFTLGGYASFIRELT